VRKIVVCELLSLDGVAEAPDSFFGWDDAVDANLAAVMGTQDAVILGRRSYTEWAQFWPSSQIEPFATFINWVTKYVATSTPLDQDWANTTAIDGGLVEFVRDLKQQRGGGVGVHASISVAQALLAADVVDELRLMIGRGRRLLDGLPSPHYRLAVQGGAVFFGFSGSTSLDGCRRLACPSLAPGGWERRASTD
jgi:dihydrofolate reductase